MKGCYCPNCGMKQKFKIDVSSKATADCPKCGRSLLIKRDPKSITVSCQDSDKIEQNLTVKATERANYN